MRKPPPETRTMTRAERIKAVGYGLEKRRRRLANSLAHCGDKPWARDLARQAALRAEIADFESVLADLMAGKDVPPSPKTGALMKEVPDAVR